jgi:hypothetical protein
MLASYELAMPQEVDVCDSGQSATSTSGYLVVFGSKSLGWKIHPTPIQSQLQDILLLV